MNDEKQYSIPEPLIAKLYNLGRKIHDEFGRYGLGVFPRGDSFDPVLIPGYSPRAVLWLSVRGIPHPRMEDVSLSLYLEPEDSGDMVYEVTYGLNDFLPARKKIERIVEPERITRSFTESITVVYQLTEEERIIDDFLKSLDLR